MNRPIKAAALPSTRSIWNALAGVAGLLAVVAGCESRPTLAPDPTDPGASVGAVILRDESNSSAVRMVRIEIEADNEVAQVDLRLAEKPNSGRETWRGSWGEHSFTVVLTADAGESPPTDPRDVPAPPVTRRGPGFRFEVFDEVGLPSDVERVDLVFEVDRGTPAGVAWPSFRTSEDGRIDVDQLASPCLGISRGSAPDLVFVPHADSWHHAVYPLPEQLYRHTSLTAAGATKLRVGLSRDARYTTASIGGTTLWFGGELVLSAPEQPAGALLRRIRNELFASATHVRNRVRPALAPPSQSAAPSGPDRWPWQVVGSLIADAKGGAITDLGSLTARAVGAVGLLPVNDGSPILETDDAARTWHLLMQVPSSDSVRAVTERSLQQLTNFALANRRADGSLVYRFQPDFLEPAASEPERVRGPSTWLAALQALDLETRRVDAQATLEAIVSELRHWLGDGVRSVAWFDPDRVDERAFFEGTPQRCTSQIAAAIRVVNDPTVAQQYDPEAAARLSHALCDLLGDLQETADLAPRQGPGETPRPRFPRGACRSWNGAAEPDAVSTSLAAIAFALAAERNGRPIDRDRAEAAFSAARFMLPSAEPSMQGQASVVLRGAPSSLREAEPVTAKDIEILSREVHSQGFATIVGRPGSTRIQPQIERGDSVLELFAVERGVMQELEVQPWLRDPSGLTTAMGFDTRLWPPAGGAVIARTITKPEPGAAPSREDVEARKPPPETPDNPRDGSWTRIDALPFRVIAPGRSPEKELIDGGESSIVTAGPRAQRRARRIPSRSSITYRFSGRSIRRFQFELEFADGSGPVRIRAGGRFVVYEDPDEPTATLGPRTLSIEVADRRAWQDGVLEFAIETTGNVPADLIQARWRGDALQFRLEAPGPQPTKSNQPSPTLRLLAVPVALRDGAFPHGIGAIRAALFDDPATGERRTPPPKPRTSAGSLASLVTDLSGGTTSLLGQLLPVQNVDRRVDELGSDPIGCARDLIASATQDIATDRLATTDVLLVVYGAGPLATELGGGEPSEINSVTTPAGRRVPVVYVPAFEADGSIVAAGRLLDRVLRARYQWPVFAGPSRGSFGQLALSAAPPLHLPPPPLGPNHVAAGWADWRPLLPKRSSARPREITLAALADSRELSVLVDEPLFLPSGPGSSEIVLERRLVLEVRRVNSTESAATQPGVLAYWLLDPRDRPQILRTDGRSTRPFVLRLSDTKTSLATPFEPADPTADLVVERLELDSDSQPSVAGHDGAAPWSFESLEALNSLDQNTSRALRARLVPHTVDLLRSARGAVWVDVLGSGQFRRLPRGPRKDPRVGGIDATGSIRPPQTTAGRIALRAELSPSGRLEYRVRGIARIVEAKGRALFRIEADGATLLQHEVEATAEPRAFPFEVEVPASNSPRTLQCVFEDREGRGCTFRLDGWTAVPVARPQFALQVAGSEDDQTLEVAGRLFGKVTLLDNRSLGVERRYRAPLILAPREAAIRVRTSPALESAAIGIRLVTRTGDQTTEFVSARKLEIPLASEVDGHAQTLLFELPVQERRAVGYVELVTSGKDETIGLLDFAVVAP